MKRALMLTLLLASTPALAADPASTYQQWKFLRDPATASIGFAQGLRFLNQHGDWPEAKVIRLRTEEAALREGAAGGPIKSFCAAYPPISGRGMLACYQAGAGSKADVKQAWLQGDFSPYEEKQILSRYGHVLNEAAHVARTDRLLFEGKTGGAQRMLPLLSGEEQRLVQARIALQSGRGDANGKLASLSTAAKRRPGVTLDRIRYRHKNGLNMDMRDLFAQGPENPPYADQWWPLRAIAVREALQAAQYGQALEMIRRHGELKPEFLAEALWLKGWITLSYRRQPQQAYEAFYALYNAVSTPVSKSRGAYWAAKAAQQNGNAEIARDWLRKAAEHPTVFYGQLAHAELSPDAALDLDHAPRVTDSARAEFARQELPRVVRMLVEMGEADMADRFIIHMAERAESAQDYALLADMANRLNARHGGVVVAKQALRKGVVLANVGWPTMNLPANLGVEPALAHAITRQESEFDARAQSSANARGLMQLLPATAAETARKLGLPYAPNEIWDPATNVTLGSAYLGRLVNARDGSYILAIASYNAGPRNVHNWVSDFGPPPADVMGAVNWIENIPFGETRNYVQRVLENLQVYRQLLKQSDRVKLAEDLQR